MLYHPDVFVYFMLLPVTFLVILPGFFATARVVIGFVQTTQVVEQDTIFGQEALNEA